MSDASIAPIRVMIVDDHQLLREGLVAVLEKASDMQVVAEARSGEEALALFAHHQPDVTLMDLRMPGQDGFATIAAIRAIAPETRIVALSTYRGDAQVQRAMKAGACGYLLKSMLCAEVLDTIRAVHAGQNCWPAHLLQSDRYHADDTLSPRETDVIRLVATGHSNKRVAAQLGISEETVKGYMRTILSKLNANDRTHAVTISLQRGILDT